VSLKQGKEEEKQKASNQQEARSVQDGKSSLPRASLQGSIPNLIDNATDVISIHRDQYWSIDLLLIAFGS
jgi:hypothetical protein